jgi:hypothetical protein
VAPQLAEITLNLRAVRKRQRRIADLKHVQSVDLQVEDGPFLRLELVEEDAYGFAAIALSVIDRLHTRHQVVSQRINASRVTSLSFARIVEGEGLQESTHTRRLLKSEIRGELQLGKDLGAHRKRVND